MMYYYDYGVYEPAIVLAALIYANKGCKPYLIENGVWYSYVVLPR